METFIEKGILRRHDLVGPAVWRMQMELPRIAKAAAPGQFIHIKIGDASHLLRRPISIAGTDSGRGLLTIYYRVVGVGTEWLSTCRTGDVLDCAGPLGRAFSETDGHTIAVGGGVGIAPMLFAAQKAPEKQMTVVIGGRDEKEVFWKDAFPDKLRELIVMTDDGSFGQKGFTTDALPKVLEAGDVKKVITCGPVIMMRKVAQLAEAANIPCEVSLERRMGCGTGGCLACVADKADGSGHVKVCKDGPVFDSREVRL